jgi:hypothetical protein
MLAGEGLVEKNQTLGTRLDGGSARIVLKNPLVRRERIAVATAIRGGRFEPFASCGEDRRRKGDELGQFS